MDGVETMRHLLCAAAPLVFAFASVAAAQSLVPDRSTANGAGSIGEAQSRVYSPTKHIPSGRSATLRLTPYFKKVRIREYAQDIRRLSASGIISGSPFRTKPIGHELGEQPETDVESLRMIGAADLNQTAPQSLTEIRRQLSAADAAANQEAIRYADIAENCVKQGKLNIAKLFYRSAIDTATGEYQQQLQARLEQLEQSEGTSR